MSISSSDDDEEDEDDDTVLKVGQHTITVHTENFVWKTLMFDLEIAGEVREISSALDFLLHTKRVLYEKHSSLDGGIAGEFWRKWEKFLQLWSFSYRNLCAYCIWS